jgi:hypothetical protein
MEHVSGACQLFRRQCFEEVGGYRPIKSGGIDWVAVTTARMKGWKTRTFPENFVTTTVQWARHHPENSRPGITWADKTTISRAILYGNCSDHVQVKKQALFPWGALLLTGFAWAFISQTKRPIDRNCRIQREQMQRLRAAFRKVVGDVVRSRHPGRITAIQLMAR